MKKKCVLGLLILFLTGSFAFAQTGKEPAGSPIEEELLSMGTLNAPVMGS